MNSVMPRPGSRGFVRTWVMTLAICLAGASMLSACNRGPDISTPKKSAAAFAKAMEEGDMNTMKKTAVGSESDFASLNNLSQLMQASKRYHNAIKDKFGEQPKDSGDMGAPDIAGQVADSEEKIDGDKATLTPKSKLAMGEGMKLKKDSDGWKVDLSEIAKQTEGMDKMSKPMLDAFDATTKEVQEGKFKSAADARVAMGTRMMGSFGH